MAKIEFIEETHTYMLDGVIIPSVSEIIRDDTYDSIPPHILENAAKRGSAVHLATEMIDKGKKPKLDSTFAEWVVQYCRFLIDYEQNHYDRIFYDSIEDIVYTNDYAGTIDRVAFIDSVTTIIDIKTTSKLYKDKIALQLGAYAYAYANLYGVDLDEIKGGVIWLRKDSWKYVEIEPNVDGFLQKLKEYKERECDEWTW